MTMLQCPECFELVQPEELAHHLMIHQEVD